MIGGGPIEASSIPEKRNKLLQELGVMKIADFGLSKSLKLHRAAGGHQEEDGLEPTPELPLPAPAAGGEGGGAAAGGRRVGSGSGRGRGVQGEGQHSFRMTGETGSYRYMAPGGWGIVGGREGCVD